MSSSTPEATAVRCAYPGCENEPRADEYTVGAKPKYCGQPDALTGKPHTALTAFRRRQELRQDGGTAEADDLGRPVTMATARAAELRKGIRADMAALTGKLAELAAQLDRAADPEVAEAQVEAVQAEARQQVADAEAKVAQEAQRRQQAEAEADEARSATLEADERRQAAEDARGQAEQHAAAARAEAGQAVADKTAAIAEAEARAARAETAAQEAIERIREEDPGTHRNRRGRAGQRDRAGRGGQGRGHRRGRGAREPRRGAGAGSDRAGPGRGAGPRARRR